MATSLNRKNRRRKKAAALVAVGASATLLAGGLVPAQASAFGVGDVLGVAACAPGGVDNDDLLFPVSADCRDADPAFIATVGDALLGLVMPNLGISLGAFNGALATAGLDFDLTLLGIFDGELFIPGKASISGTGYNTALVIFGGEAHASSDYYLAASAAIAAAGGVANASSLFGASLATAVGRPAGKVGLGGDLSLGFDALNNSATAKALPFGVAIANSSNVLAGLNNLPSLVGGGNEDERHASATALGGIAAAYSAVDGSEGAVCTAIYADASVTDADGKNIASCTSILFIFQKSQEGEGPVVYAIKNPFDLNLVSPFGDDFATLISKVASLGEGAMPVDIPEEFFDLLAGKFVPEFDSDIVRVSFENGKPTFGTDLPAFFGGIFGQQSASAPLLGLDDLGLKKYDLQSMSGYGIGGPAVSQDVPLGADDAVELDVTADDARTPDAAQPVEVPAAPVEQAPAVAEAPVAESPAVDLGSSGSDPSDSAPLAALEPAL